MSKPISSQLQITLKGVNQRKEDGLLGGGFVDYTISTICNHPAFPAGYFTVDRRYSDFVWLREELAKTYPAIIIPALPEKAVLGNMESSFVEARKRGLQKFLTKVAGNPTLVESPRFVKFVTATDKVFALERQSTEQKQQEEMKDNFTSWWDKSYTNVFNSFTSATRPVDVVSVKQLECEGEIEEVIQYIERLEGYTDKLIKTAQLKITNDEATAMSYNQFGNAFLALSGREHGLAASAFGQIGQRSVQVHDNGKALCLSEQELFLEPIKEFHRYILSTKETLQRREDRKKAYAKAVKEANKMAGRTDDKKTQADLDESLAKVESTKKEFMQVSTDFLTEFSRFKYESSGDMVDAMFQFTRLQADFHKRAAMLWDEYQEYQFVAVPVADQQNCTLS